MKNAKINFALAQQGQQGLDVSSSDVAEMKSSLCIFAQLIYSNLLYCARQQKMFSILLEHPGATADTWLAL